MWNWTTELEKARIAARPLALVTVAGASGSAPREIGAKMIVFADGSFQGTIGGGNLEHLAIRDALATLAEGRSRSFRYPLGAKTGQCCGGVVEILAEILNLGPRLYLFGGGHVGQAVCRTLSGTPFTVHLIDDRDEWVNAPGLPEDVIRFRGSWDEFAARATWDAEKTYIAVMTHRHDLDLEIVEGLIDHPHRYLGLIGSRGKWARFRQRMEFKGVDVSRFERVRCPLGLVPLGKAPQEVAVSLAAELLAIHHRKLEAIQKPGLSLARTQPRNLAEAPPRA
jgi:xanthine dehydrogenase accessory factor